MKQSNTRNKLSVICALLIIIFTVWSVTDMFLHVGSGNMQVSRAVVFRYFTVDSNILSAVSVLALLIWRLTGSGRKRPAGEVPAALTALRFMGAVSVTVTLMTVLCFLGLLYGYASMFAGWNFYLHLAGPLLSIAAFVWFDPGKSLPGKMVWTSLIPTALYGAVYLYLVVVVGADNGGWPDFYGFNIGGRWMISLAAMLLATLLIGIVLHLARKKAGRK